MLQVAKTSATGSKTVLRYRNNGICGLLEILCAYDIMNKSDSSQRGTVSDCEEDRNRTILFPYPRVPNIHHWLQNKRRNLEHRTEHMHLSRS